MKTRSIIILTLVIVFSFSGMMNYQISEKTKMPIPFKLVLNYIILSAKFNDKQELKLVLDTGMPIGGAILFESKNINALGLKYIAPCMVGGAGGEPVSANIARGVEINIQNCRLKDQQVIVMPINQNVVTALNTHGIIGYELFGRYLVQIDFENELINLFEPNPTIAINLGSEVPLEFKQNYPFIACSANLGTRGIVPLNLVVDLGANHAISLDTESSDNILLPRDNLIIRVGSGAIGDIQGHVGRTKKLRIGDYSFSNVISTFTSGPIAKGFLKCHGNLGVGLLRRFQVTFDYINSKMYLQPNRYFDDPFEFNMAGFQFQKTKDGLFKVDHVINESPASESGIKANDLILEINSQPANQFSADFLNKLLLREGKSIDLKVQREEKYHVFSLRLRKLV